MTTEWPEALRIADLFEVFGTNELAKKAAAELRRLHAANLDCMAWYEAIKSDYDRLKAEHEALRKAVIKLEDVLTNLPLSSPQRMRARIQRLEEMLAAVGAGGVGPLIPATVQHQREPSSDNDLPIENGQLITSRSTVPADWKPVPLELTQAMLDQLRFGWSDISTAHVFDRWKRTVAAAPQPPVVGQSDNDTVPVPRSLLGAACAAINRKQDAPKLLEQLRRYTTGDLSQPAGEQLESEGRQAFGAEQQVSNPVESHQIEPVAVVDFTTEGWRKIVDALRTLPDGAQLYTHPQPRLQPLTDEEILKLAYPLRWDEVDDFEADRAINFAQVIERAHGIEGQA